MRAKSYLRQIEKDLPAWSGKGWVAEGGADAILAELRERASGGNVAPLAFGVLGALTLGAGVITFFAANWQEMAKIWKLAILFGGLWLAIAAAGLAMRRDVAPMIGHALLLLIVVLFGANIQLIAQIYHIEAHYPNGVLMWSLGALALTALVPSQPVAIAGLVLAVLWTYLESFEFWRSIHYPFLLVWLGFAAIIVKQRWVPARHVALLALVLWCWITIAASGFFGRSHAGDPVYLTGLYVVLAAAAYVLGLICAERDWGGGAAQTIKAYALILGFGALYGLGIHEAQKEASGHALSTGWIAALGVAAALLALAIVSRRRTGNRPRARLIDWIGWGLSATLALAVAGLLFDWPSAEIRTGAFKALMFAATLWFVFHGYRAQERAVVNIAFAFFAIGLVTFYFETFWTLMNRSFFLMGGGVLLLGGGYLLERQRRRLIAGMGEQP